MISECSKLVYSSRKNWDELINITFVKDNFYLSFNSLVYEDEIDIELNDQTNQQKKHTSNLKLVE